MKINWKEEGEGGQYEMYPEGGYVFKIDSWEKTAASTGTAQVRFYFNILEPETHKGKTYIDHFALTDKALWRLADFVGKSGINLETLGEMEVGSPAFKKVLDSLKSKRIGAYVNVETYNGKQRNKIGEYIRVETDTVDSVDMLDDVPEWVKEGVKTGIKTVKNDLI